MVIHAPTRIYDHSLGLFTDAELDSAERFFDGLTLIRASLNTPTSGPAYDDSVRVTRFASIPQAAEIAWFYKRLAEIVQELNARNFQFDLRGFSEMPQFMVYHASENGHFDWHFDTGPLPQLKLSVTVQLTDPSQYEGGQLQFNMGTRVVLTPKDRGAVIVFPSYMMHRVTPVTAGTRKAVVAWATGPAFK